MQTRESSLKRAGKSDQDRQIYDTLLPVIKGLGMSLIELSVFRASKAKPLGNVQVKLIVQHSGRDDRVTGVDDCSRVHRAVTPRLELIFPGREIYLEVSSPGIDRLIKYTEEFEHYIGREIKCYRIDISDWSSGKLISVDSDKIILRNKDGDLNLSFDIIAKARLSSAAPRPGAGG